MMVPLSGPWARSGLLEQMGARMAIDDVNAAGGIKALGGAKMKLVEFDAGRQRRKGQGRRATHGRAGARSGGRLRRWLSSFTLAITEVTERAEMPWLTLSYSDAITGRGFNYVFQSSPTADAQAEETVPIIMDLRDQGIGQEADQDRHRWRQLGLVRQLPEADPRSRRAKSRADDRRR